MSTSDTAPCLVGSCSAMQKLWRRLLQVARSTAPLLLIGETGTGKEVVAREYRRLHASHLNCNDEPPWVSVNCGGFTPALAASELFGHVRGAFTGAAHHQTGAFATAHGGTLFLDEVGELPLTVQPLLLRALELGEVRPVGAVQPRRVNVHIIAATHRNLRHDVAAGRFREDLWHRLGVLVVTLPPLRQRLEDLPALIETLCTQLQQPHLRFTPKAWAKLLSHRWPGNVRELKNVLHRAWVFGAQTHVDTEGLDLQTEPLDAPARIPPSRPSTLLHEVERATIAAALAQNNGNRRVTAAALGCSRSTLYRRIKSLTDLRARGSQLVRCKQR